MQQSIINSAVFHCIEYSAGHSGAAAEFITSLRADDAWSKSGVDMVEYLALPIVSETLVFELFDCTPLLTV